jgi:ATP-dependent RNA helicase DeaD
MPEPIKELADDILYNPECVSVVNKDEATTNNIIEQRYYVINEYQRDDAIVKLLETEDTDKCIIFCRMKREVDRLSEHLSALGFNARGLHGDMEQQQRDEMIKGYRRGQIKIMVATDVASRGLDVKNVSHVFNYHIPFDPQSYVHRIGRTGRAGKSGQAITLVSTDEFRELQRIQKEVGADMRLATIEDKSTIDSSSIDEIAYKIRNSEINSNVDELLNRLKDMEHSLFLRKIASMVIAKESSLSNNIIGLNQDMVDEMMGNYLGEKKSFRGNNRKRRRR